MKNIRVILLGELVLLIAIFYFTLFHAGMSEATHFLDLPTLILIVLTFVLGLLLMGAWKDFIRAFSVGIRPYSLLELKNVIGAVSTAQKLTILGALFSILTSASLLLWNLDDPTVIGPAMATCLISGFYAVIIEFFLLPLRLNAEKKMNEEMDLGDD